MFTLAIIGGGFVGTAAKLFENESIRCLIYDLDPSKCSPGITMIEQVAHADLFFICVPTPMNTTTGECHTGIVSKCIDNIRQVRPDAQIVIRSTVPVGFSQAHGCHFMPEFLTERNWYQDTFNCPEWFLGVDDNSTNAIETLKKLFALSPFASAKCTVVSTKEAEAIKYFRNCFLAVKVGFCNEFEQFCSTSGLKYENVIECAARDSRIGSSHTMVPGPDGKRGFGGTCLPKDMNSLRFQMKTLGVNHSIVSAAILRNETIDRVEQDWKEDTGRAVL